jgi:hypothetical protein
MKTYLGRILLLAAAVAGVAVSAADFTAGVARVKITPPMPFWMSGYAARTHPAEGVLQDLWAKALALRDPEGKPFVLVTTDLIGIPAGVSDEVARRAKAKFQLDRDQIVLSCSHTHCGPALHGNLGVMFDFDEAEAARVRQYAADLVAKIVAIVGEALQAQQPTQLAFAQGAAGFAVNRRLRGPTGFRISVNPAGPVDHSVPVLKIAGPDGRLRAVLFAYACHNTTLGSDFYQLNGDYAGFAQAEFEQAHPDATAMFMMLCGGDQNPNPRGKVEQAQQYGKELAAAVAQALAGELRPVRPPIRATFEHLTLDLAPHTRAQFEEETTNKDKFRQRRARAMLATYDAGRPIRTVRYPVQAVRFGGDLTLLTLGGEVVIDYALRAKREFAGENLVVAGYCNDVMCYIPSLRVLKEGGYEAVDSMIYYGMPGPFAEAVEEQIFTGVRRVMRMAGAQPTAPPVASTR